MDPSVAEAVAVIVVEPDREMITARPDAFIVAMLLSDDVHVTRLEMSCDVPSENKPIA